MEKEKVILVTLAIGERYLANYNLIFRKSQENYAKKHGYDFKVIEDYLDKNLQHPHAISFQKILVCNQEWSKNYKYVVWIDADILIHPDSPALTDVFKDIGVNVGIVDEYTQPTRELRLQVQKKCGWEETAKEYYNYCKLDIETDQVLNTGLIIMQPDLHADFFQRIYNKYAKFSIGHFRGFHYEQACIGYELQKNNLFKVITNKFNALWPIHKFAYSEDNDLSKYFNDNYFVHFAGRCDYDKIKSIKI